MSEPTGNTERITDARVLRAMAHPLRVRIANTLVLMGSATATQIAEAVGDTPANCSWHMRQLAKYGFIEAAPGGTGRERPWRLVAVARSWDDEGDDAELAIAGDAAAEVLLDYEVQALRSWHKDRGHEPAEWRHASNLSQSIQWLTVEELASLNHEFQALMGRHLERLGDASARPPGSRPIRLVSWLVPAAPLHVAYTPTVGQAQDAAPAEDLGQAEDPAPAPDAEHVHDVAPAPEGDDNA
ncbi:MAG TPA: winged helix-turn-helix domain-containing protein [Micromonosporaceae bacterium]|jgi:DNA-binding transcriptional ArsR family regulator